MGDPEEQEKRSFTRQGHWILHPHRATAQTRPYKTPPHLTPTQKPPGPTRGNWRLALVYSRVTRILKSNNSSSLRRHALIFGLGIVLLLAGCREKVDRAVKQFNLGNEEYFAFDFTEAKELYETSLDLYPDLAMARNNLGNLYFRMEDFETAIDQFDLVLLDQPEYTKALYNRAIARGYEGDYPGAIEDFNWVISWFRYELERADSLCNVCQSIVVKNSVKDTVYLDDFPQPRTGREYGFSMLRDLIPPLEGVRVSLNYNGTFRNRYGESTTANNANWITLILDSSVTTQNFPECLDLFCRTAEQLNEDSLRATLEERYEAYHSRFYLLNKVARVSTTASDTLNFRTLWSRHALGIAHLMRGIVHQHLREYRAATADYNQAIYYRRDANSQIKARIRKGFYYMNLGNCFQAMATNRGDSSSAQLFRFAVANYDSVIADVQDTSLRLAARYERAVSLLGLYAAADPAQPRPNLDSIRQEFTALITINPSDSDFLTKLGNCWQGLQQLDSAVSAYSLALEVNPDDIDALFNRGNCFYAQGFPPTAIADYTACIERKPDYANAWFMRGNARFDAYDSTGAMSDFAKAGELGHPTAFWEMERLSQGL